MTNYALQDWLDVATRDLCADARERVCGEVRAHYAAAYDALIASGESADVAVGGALFSLGSAKKARRKYRRSYVTKREQKYLDSLADTSTAWLATPGAILAVLTVLFQSVFSGSKAVIIHAVLLIALLLGTIAYLIWARIRFRHDPKRLMRLLAIGMTFYAIPILVLGTFYMHVTSQPPMNGALLTESGLAIIGSIFALLCVMVIFFRNKLMRLHRKLVALDVQGPLGKNSEK